MIEIARYVLWLLREVIGMSIFEYHEDQEEEIRKMEYRDGRKDERREIAISLAEDGESVERIAKVLHESEETIQRWLKYKKSRTISQKENKITGSGDMIYERGMRKIKQEGIILGALMSGKTLAESIPRHIRRSPRTAPNVRIVWSMSLICSLFSGRSE